MLDHAVKCPLTPVLTVSNNEQLFKVVRSDSLSYHIGPKINLNFLRVALFLGGYSLEAGVCLGQFSRGIFLLVLNLYKGD